ncbi:hypothetical protein SDC9_79628 [bioreactor metagenome]|uniref:Glycosyltransferase 2-like domain-containing protein n=1 Tax=bioreactor metagenome TaxID=1076179 RepID=A0A644YYZ8_9ZZZZ
MSSKNLSVLILTHRADPLFTQVLQSAHFAEFLLIADYQSGNDWKKLRQELGRNTRNLRVFPQAKKQIQDFAAARNELIQKAESDWIFFLDSDEVLPPEAEEILNLCKEKNNYCLYKVSRHDVFHGKTLHFGESWHDQPIRFARKDSLRFTGAVHEIAKVQKNQKIGHLDFSLQHFSHKNLTEFFAAIDQYCQIESQTRYQKAPTKQQILKELFLLPPLKFILNYFFRLGFCDGFAGFAYAIMMSLHSLLLRIYLYEKYFIA